MNKIKVSFEGIKVLFKIEDFDLFKIIKKRLKSFISNEKETHAIIEYNKEKVSFSSKNKKINKSLKRLEIISKKFKMTSNETDKYIKFKFSVQPYIEILLLQFDRLVIHSSFVQKNKEGFMFVGQRKFLIGGDGKTTICKLIKKKKVINDDNNIIWIERNSFLGSSFFLQGRLKPNKGKIPIKKIFFLKKNNKTFIRKISYLDAFSSISRQNYLYYLYQKYYGEEIKSILIELLKKVPFYELNFEKKEIVNGYIK